MAPCNVLTVNGGSSSIKFALFRTEPTLDRILTGKIDGIGVSESSFTIKAADPGQSLSRRVDAPDHVRAVRLLMDWVEERLRANKLAAVGHRVVHGGPAYSDSQRITAPLVQELHQLSPLDPDHLPEEILLTESFHGRFPDLPQVACFDTAFHRTMPRVARLLPIPRRYEAAGVQRYGFHGLSCTYLMDELARQAGEQAARGRVLLAHLGNGASITAVRERKSVDTTMGFTPTAGLPMSTRSGDLDPGVAWYLARAEQMSARQFHEMVNHQSGLLGISQTSPDVRALLARESADERAADALAVFCYQARKWICALAGALEGLDTLVFAGGIGENAPEIRARICRGLEFLGLELDAERNQANAAVVTGPNSRIVVRVIRTDEELVIAKETCRVLGLNTQKDSS